MNQKVVRIVLLLCALSALVVACGGGGVPQEEPVTEIEADTTAVEEVSEEPADVEEAEEDPAEAIEEPVEEEVREEEETPIVTVSVDDFFSHIPPPEECDPARDTGPEPNYAPLEQFPQEVVEDTIFDANAFSVAIQYVNEKGQNFVITVSAATEEIVRDYISQAAACLEAIPAGGPPPEVAEPVKLDIALINAAIEYTGVSATELAQRRDELGAEGTATFADVIASFGVDPEEVLNLATERLTDEGVDGDTLEEDLRVLLELLDAPFLTDPEHQPESDGGYASRFEEDENIVIIYSEWQLSPEDQQSGEEDWVIYFAYDPLIDRYEYDYYKAKCQRSAWSAIRAWAGSASVYMWRQSPYFYIGSRYDSAASAGYSSWLYHSSSPQYRTYDAGVRGWQDGSSYSVYGGWYTGSGGGC
jgi:hypothetical protein